MRQTKVLNSEPSAKVGEVKTSQGHLPAMVLCFLDHDTNEMVEYPIPGPLAPSYRDMIAGVVDEMPEIPPDLVIPQGPVSEDDLAKMASVVSGKPPFAP